jgi:hypothetical protein
VADAVPIATATYVTPVQHVTPTRLPRRTTKQLSPVSFSPPSAKFGSTRRLNTSFGDLSPAGKKTEKKNYTGSKEAAVTDEAGSDTTAQRDEQFPVPPGFAEAFEASLEKSQLAAEFSDLADNLVD